MEHHPKIATMSLPEYTIDKQPDYTDIGTKIDKVVEENFEMNTVYVFIDASNLWEAFKAKGKFLDFSKTIDHIKGRFGATSVKAFYYTAYPAGN